MDLLDDLVSHHLRNVLFVKIVSLEIIFGEISDDITRRIYRGVFLEILYEFIDSFEEITDEVKCIDELIRDEDLDEPGSEWCDYVLLKSGCIFLHGTKNIVLVYLKNDTYYRLNTKNIRGYQRHSEVMNFFIKRGFKLDKGYTFASLTEF